MAKEETNGTKEKAQAGSSIPAQAKQLVLALVTETKENEPNEEALAGNVLMEVSQSTFDWLTNLATEIAKTSLRGLPLATQLENAQKALAEHYTTCPTNTDGTPNFTKEWVKEQLRLVNKRDALEAKLTAEKEAAKEAKKQEKETAKAETAK